jgi:hypothetical protein
MKNGSRGIAPKNLSVLIFFVTACPTSIFSFRQELPVEKNPYVISI